MGGFCGAQLSGVIRVGPSVGSFHIFGSLGSFGHFARSALSFSNSSTARRRVAFRDDGEGGGGEAVRAGIARTGGVGGVGAIDGALFLGDGRLGRESVLPISDIACEGGESAMGRSQVVGRRGIYFVGGDVIE
jgi:hypothetical protein